MRRGDFVIVALQGDFGKPRPALVVRSDAFRSLPSVTICPLSSDLGPGREMTRLDVQPTTANGLRVPSQIAIDRISTARPRQLGPVIGHADADLMRAVDQALAVYLGIA